MNYMIFIYVWFGIKVIDLDIAVLLEMEYDYRTEVSFIGETLKIV